MLNLLGQTGKGVAVNKRPPEVRQRIRDGVRRSWADPQVRQRRSESIKRAWADPEVRQRISDGIKRSSANPEVRQRISDGLKRALAHPEVRQRRSETAKRSLADPHVRKRISDGVKRAWANPQVRQRMRECAKASWTTERRVALGNRARKFWDERKSALQAASRWPLDWWDRPIMWRIIGDLILSCNGSISNRELGKALDAAQLIECPYSDTWCTALSSNARAKSNAATALVGKIRRWVKKPGRSSRAKVPVNYFSQSA